MYTLVYIFTTNVFAIFFFIFWCGMWALHLIAFGWSFWRLRRKRSPMSPEAVLLPGVSIIKPLLGSDPNLQSNLETFFTMSYPKYEILFCVQDSNDPVIRIVKDLITKYPLADVEIFIEDKRVGINPKINNMQSAYIAAKHELILVSDSSIRMKEDTLRDMVSFMDDNTGLVHQMPFVCDRAGFPAIVEKVYFGTSHGWMYLVADCLGISCPARMSVLIRKTLLEEAGGIKEFGYNLAEDYFFTQSIMSQGWKISLSSQPAWQNSGFCDIQSFQMRISRWTKLKFSMIPMLIIMAEPFTECMLLGISAGLSIQILFEWDPIVFFLIHLLSWCILDWMLLRSIQSGPLPFKKYEYVLAWLFREVSAPFLFCRSLWFPNILWRQDNYLRHWDREEEELL